MASTAAVIFATTPLAGIDLDSKASTFAFPVLFTCTANDGRQHTVALAQGTLASTANITLGAAGSAASAASAGVANSFNVNTTGGVVIGQKFFAKSNFV
jgi:hypothetical protein